jgi:hypothetical protein
MKRILLTWTLLLAVYASALAAPGRPPVRKQESGAPAKGLGILDSETAVLDRATIPLLSKQESGR